MTGKGDLFVSGKKKNTKNQTNKNGNAKKSNTSNGNSRVAASETSNRILPVIAGVVVAAAVAVIAVSRLGGSTEDESQSVSNSSSSALTEMNENTIAVNEVGATASYYDYDVDGTTVEVLAVTATDGTVQLALNTCQVCQGSPYAYFVQEGDSFICQNCGNAFSRDDIGLEAGGCNPVPVTEEYYEESDGVITISEDFLKEYKDSFANWKNA